MWYRCKRSVEFASPVSLCVYQHSWHPTSKDLGIAKTLNKLHYIAFTNEQDEAYPLVVIYIQLSTHSFIHTYKLHIHAFIHMYVHTYYTYIHLNAYTHTHTYVHMYICTYIYTHMRTHVCTYTHTNIHYLHAFPWSIVPPHGIWIWKKLQYYKNMIIFNNH